MHILQPAVDVPAVAPQPCGLSRETISAIAGNVAAECAYSPGDDLNQLVESMGGVIEYGVDDADAMYTGSIDIRSPDDFTIYLPLDTGLSRDRFTIAHELGHLVLHYLFPIQVQHATIPRMKAARYGGSRAETEANWFAAAFLMPEQLFSEAFMETNRNLAAVAAKFGVSAHAAAVRVQSLGL